MPRRSGRPSKSDNLVNTKSRIIDAAITLITEKGADSVTVRNVCAAADLSIGTFYHHFRDKDDLLMYFLRESSFEEYALETELSQIADRISELYMHLIDRYLELGESFMKSFYSTDNHSLSAYMGEKDGTFPPDTVMARSEKELLAAMKAGYIKDGTDIHAVCMDICTIVKGCVFEWCLSDGKAEIKASVYRIIDHYLFPYTTLSSKKTTD